MGGPARDPIVDFKDFLDEHAACFGHGAGVLEGARLRRDAATPQ